MRVDRSLGASALATLALLLAAGCSSKNPDALTGMNVDENLAMMNADENMDANAAEPAAPRSQAPMSNQASDAIASAKPRQVATDDDQGANASETDQVIQPDEPTTGDQSDENEDAPHSQY